MSYSICRYTKEFLEDSIKNMIKVHSENSDLTGGYMSKTTALETILYFAFCEEAWNEKNDCPATNFTIAENYGFRYHLYSPEKRDVIYNPLKKEDALVICEKILNNMVKKNLIVFSKSGKGVKYIG